MQPKNWVICHAMPTGCWPATNVVLMDCHNASQSTNRIHSDYVTKMPDLFDPHRKAGHESTTEGAHPFTAESREYGARRGARGRKSAKICPPILFRSLSLSTLRIGNREEPSMRNLNQELAAKKSKTWFRLNLT